MSKIIFLIELVETEKDQPKEDEFSKPELKDEMPKTSALCCHRTKSIWGSNQVYLLDSGFGYTTTLPELEKKDIFGTTVFKKKGVGWPAGSDAKTVLDHMQGKDVGYKTVWKASSEKYPGTNLCLATLADREHTSIMANTWSTTLPKTKRKCRVGGELVEIDIILLMTTITIARDGFCLKRHSLLITGNCDDLGLLLHCLR